MHTFVVTSSNYKTVMIGVIESLQQTVSLLVCKSVYELFDDSRFVRNVLSHDFDQ